MKAPAFWYNPDGLMAQALTPLGAAYGMASSLRRLAMRRVRFNIPVICVGNVVVGGAGKTPTALAIAAHLKKSGAQPVFVTRGYGGSAKGPLRVDPARHTFRDVGDEALLLASFAPCWVGRNRAEAISAAAPFGTHVILDDGLQNPSLAPSFSLLVIDGETGLGNGRLMPAGPLRETLEQAMRRVDAIVLIGEDRHALMSSFNKPVLLARVQPQVGKINREQSYFAFAGIGRPEKFFDTCRAVGLTLHGTRSFPDHHTFSGRDLADLSQHARAHGLKLITTAKDYVRLPPDFRAQVVVLPIELTFADPALVEALIRE